MKQTSILFFALVVFFASCKTEVDLNAPYKNTTIIFGLLDPDSDGDGDSDQLDTQWVKINKTFLGEGDNTVYAAIRDSSEYKDEDFVKKVVERIKNGEVVAEYNLVSKTTTDRNVGDNLIFYGPEQTVYYFVPVDNSQYQDSYIGLDQDSEYRIVLEFKDDRVVTATTKVVYTPNFVWNSPRQDVAPILAYLSTTGNFSYTNEVPVGWKSVPNASIYDVQLRFYFLEKKYSSTNWNQPAEDSTMKFVDFYVGSLTEDEINGSQDPKINFNGRSFFTFLQNNLSVDPTIRREIGSYNQAEDRTDCFEVIITMGNDDLKSYIDVNSPSTGVVQERPIYSNVSNGIGLFAARNTKRLKNLPLIPPTGQPNLGTLAALVTSEYTAGLNFCDRHSSNVLYRCN